jgi:3-isopropylmalate dehydrogenase
MIVVRENTEDVYAGIGGFLKKGTPDEVAVQEMIFTRKGVERVIRYAFALARARGKARKLTLVDKANAVGAMDIWTRAFEEVGREFTDIERDHAYIDAACMWMVKNPESFDTIVVSNMFGDILTDLGAMITGGLGIAASGNIHPGKTSMFEPVHGSAPKYAGLDRADPTAMILSGVLMLRHLGETDAADRIEAAVREVIADGRAVTPDLGGSAGTQAMADAIVDAVANRRGAPTPMAVPAS